MLTKKLTLLVLIVLIAAPFIAILLNRVPLLTAPGPVARLKSYFTENDRSTEQAGQFPELSPLPLPGVNTKQALESVKQAVTGLGWTLLAVDQQHNTAHAEIVTPLLRFRDDIHIGLEPILAENQTLVHIRSHSRVGRGDFGANIRHILDLRTALQSN